MLELDNIRTKARPTVTISEEQGPAEQLRRQLKAVAGELHQPPKERRANLDRLLQTMSRMPGIRQRSQEPFFNDSLEGFSRKIDVFLRSTNLDAANIDLQDSQAILTVTVKYFKGVLKNKERDYFRQLKRHSTFTIPDTNKKGKVISIDLPIGDADGKQNTVEDIIPDQRLTSGWEWIEIEGNKSRHEALKNYLETDPEDILKSYYPKDNPQANLWEIVKRRILQQPPQGWKEIPQDLGVKYGTITAYSNRNLSLVLQWVFIQKIDKYHGCKWREFIEEDAEGILRDQRLEGCPECNGQEVAKGLLLPEDKPGEMKAIAERFKVKTGDIKEFWETQCLPCFQDMI